MHKDTLGRKLYRVEIETDNGFHGVYWVADRSVLPGYDWEAQVRILMNKIHRITDGFPTLIGVTD